MIAEWPKHWRPSSCTPISTWTVRACEYPIWVTGADVVAQTAVICPCCRARTWVIDADGSFQNAGRIIEQQVNQALKGLWQ
jgi:hypothetical protein